MPPKNVLVALLIGLLAIMTSAQNTIGQPSPGPRDGSEKGRSDDNPTLFIRALVAGDREWMESEVRGVMPEWMTCESHPNRFICYYPRKEQADLLFGFYFEPNISTNLISTLSRASTLSPQAIQMRTRILNEVLGFGYARECIEQPPETPEARRYRVFAAVEISCMQDKDPQGRYVEAIIWKRNK